MAVLAAALGVRWLRRPKSLEEELLEAEKVGKMLEEAKGRQRAASAAQALAAKAGARNRKHQRNRDRKERRRLVEGQLEEDSVSTGSSGSSGDAPGWPSSPSSQLAEPQPLEEQGSWTPVQDRLQKKQARKSEQKKSAAKKPDARSGEIKKRGSGKAAPKPAPQASPKRQPARRSPSAEAAPKQAAPKLAASPKPQGNGKPAHDKRGAGAKSPPKADDNGRRKPTKQNGKPTKQSSPAGRKLPGKPAAGGGGGKGGGANSRGTNKPKAAASGSKPPRASAWGDPNAPKGGKAKANDAVEKARQASEEMRPNMASLAFEGMPQPVEAQAKRMLSPAFATHAEVGSAKAASGECPLAPLHLLTSPAAPFVYCPVCLPLPRPCSWCIRLLSSPADLPRQPRLLCLAQLTQIVVAAADGKVPSSPGILFGSFDQWGGPLDKKSEPAAGGAPSEPQQAEQPTAWEGTPTVAAPADDVRSVCHTLHTRRALAKHKPPLLEFPEDSAVVATNI